MLTETAPWTKEDYKHWCKRYQSSYQAVIINRRTILIAGNPMALRRARRRNFWSVNCIPL